MLKFRSTLILVLCLVLLSGCGQSTPSDSTPSDSTPSDSTVPVQATIATTAATTPAETDPPETTAATTTAAAEETEAPAEYIPEGDRDPALAPPEAPEGPCHYFDDAAFIGDSISYTLMLHNTKTGDFGDALFLVRGSLGIHNTLSKFLKLHYQGQQLTPWDALQASGVNKVFIMLGMNDIGYYGIDATMEKWVEYVDNIRTACPDIQIHIQAQTPMWTEGAKGILNNENIDIYNQRLKEFAEEHDCYFLDATPYLKDSTGSLAKPYCNDFYVHMNYDGTAVWADFLKVYGTEMEKENP